MTSDPYDLLERELVGAVERRAVLNVAPASPRARRGRHGRRLFLGAVAAALTVGAGAWAASSLLSSGDPVPYRYGTPPSADVHYGTAVPGSIAMLTDEVPDPDGGLPWGLRTFKTNRGFGCIQVGRVQEGKLGVLALESRRGAVSERGLFHELRPAVTGQATSCVQLDGAENAFVALHTVLTTDVTTTPCAYNSVERSKSRCPPGTLRTVDAGLLGPRAASLAYRNDGHRETAQALGTPGGYLVVQRYLKPTTSHRTFGGRNFEFTSEPYLSVTPASRVVTRVNYDGAPSCVVRPTRDPQGACPKPPGLTPIPQPAPASTRAAIRAFAAPDRRGIRLRFRAPIAIADARSDYLVFVRGPLRTCPPRRNGAPRRRGAKCFGGNGFGTSLDRNIAAGALVKTTIDIPNLGLDHHPWLRAGHSYRVTVSYRLQPPYPRVFPGFPTRGYHVGAATVNVK